MVAVGFNMVKTFKFRASGREILRLYSIIFNIIGQLSFGLSSSYRLLIRHVTIGNLTTLYVIQRTHFNIILKRIWFKITRSIEKNILSVPYTEFIFQF